MHSFLLFIFYFVYFNLTFPNLCYYFLFVKAKCIYILIMSTSFISVSTPVSGHTTMENESLMLVDKVKKYDTSAFILFSINQDLGLNEIALKILEDEEVNSRNFLDRSRKGLNIIE